MQQRIRRRLHLFFMWWTGKKGRPNWCFCHFTYCFYGKGIWSFSLFSSSIKVRFNFRKRSAFTVWSVRSVGQKSHSRILGCLASHSPTQKLSVCPVLFVFVASPRLTALWMTVYIMLQTDMSIRQIHAPFPALEVVNSSISESDTCLANSFCYCSALWVSDRLRGGGGMFKERRDQRFYEPAFCPP